VIIQSTVCFNLFCIYWKPFRRRSVAKQKGMVFGFRKTATAVTRPER